MRAHGSTVACGAGSGGDAAADRVYRLGVHVDLAIRALVLGLAGVAVSTGCQAEPERPPLRRAPVSELSTVNVADLLEADAAAVFGHRRLPHQIPGGHGLDFGGFTAEDLPARRDAKLIFYCEGDPCHASRRAADRAVRLGYSDVSIMPAGLTG